MIKILYVVSSLKRTGPINILFDLVKYLDRSRFTPHILTLRSEPPNSRYPEFVKLNVEIDSLHHDGKILTPGAVHEFKKMVTRIRPQVVHSMGFRPDVLSGFFI